MIGILLLGFLVELLYYSWILMRKVASLDTRWQFCVAALPICLILLVPIQFFSGYSLASVWGQLIIVAVACFANVLLMFLLWHKSRTTFIEGLAVSVSFWIGSYFGCFAVLLTAVGNASTVPAAEGRISPIASYRVVQDLGIWGGVPQSYTYEIYRNPRWLPFVWKEVMHERVPCGQGFDAGGLLIGAGANDHLVVISCRKPEPAFISKQIPIETE